MNAHVLIAFWVLLATATVAQSRRWFAREVGCWITQKKVPASWEDAQQRCERDGAILASPLNTQLLNYMQSLINVHNHSAAYFIGTRANRSDDGQEVHYVSEEGRRLDDMPYAVFVEIDQLDIEQGDCLSMDRRGIRAVSCWDHLPYICYSNDTTECGSVTSTENASLATRVLTGSAATLRARCAVASAVPVTCADGYTYKPTTGSWYKYHKNEISWSAAASVCASEGGYLVVVNDAVEAETVRDIMRDGGYGTYQYVWIGLQDDQGVSYWQTIRGYTYKPTTGSWYKYHKNEISWSAAASVCASEGGYLVVVNDAVEAETVRDIMRDGGYGTYQYVWIGLQDDQGVSYWQTIRGQPISEVYNGWSSSRQANDASWKCAVLNQDKLLYNWTCEGNTNFIFEMSL